MLPLARTLVLFGVVLIVVGGLIYLIGKTGIPLGRLPGDIRIQSGGMTCFIPLVTSLILSVALTILLNIVVRFLNR